jgi:hypothetical protein
MQAGNAVRLGQDHRAELAGADQADTHGTAGFGAGAEHGKQIHDVTSCGI